MEVSVHLTLCFIKHYRGLQSRGRRFDSDPRLIYFSCRVLLMTGAQNHGDPYRTAGHYAHTR